MEDQPQIIEMPFERIIETLYELKGEMLKRSPSKYFFALGHAIRMIESLPPNNRCSLQEGRGNLANGSKRS